ncbi:DUF1847 domain-containing protein [Selenomonas ruminantium]|uniref:Uncharacterized metal-binding protein n=1 Tax=Selenomonas ruminantium TaxID=971 RepID=A0A1I0WCL0_SELRU|nr:DUF1847 domain-containing protein [Selenomonas ruminantium]SFA86479.1 Uncharacterized metal-binding protein [Selenomonas ruminantium]
MLGDCANCNANHMCFQKGRSCVPVEQEQVLALYDKEERKIMKAAAYVEATFYMKYTRLQETAAFARKMGYKTLGLGFCMGIREEARFFAQFFTQEGFTVKSVCCKNCSVPKEVLKLKKVNPESTIEPMCNPKAQAKYLNENGAELFISAGLCVGHDALFSKAANGPVTTLVVKDRVLGNNPMAVAYSGYWKKKLAIKD